VKSSIKQAKKRECTERQKHNTKFKTQLKIELECFAKLQGNSKNLDLYFFNKYQSITNNFKSPV